MPTIFTHALLPLIGASSLPRTRLPKPLIAMGMTAAMLPDADVISTLFGIPHTHIFGHRGATHSLAFALLVGSIGAMCAPALQAGRIGAFLFLLLATLSHPLTDMLTNGGKGLPLFWPVDGMRIASPIRPVEVSPIGLRGFESGRIWVVLLSESLWLLLPATLVAFFCRLTAKSGLHETHG